MNFDTSQIRAKRQRSLYVASQTGGTLSTIDTATNTVMPGAVTVGPAPGSVAVSADGSVAYVANGNDTVSVINTATSAVVSPVRFDTDATGAHAVAVAPSGAVYVTDATDRTVRVLVQPSLIATSVTKIGSVGVSGVGSTLLSNDGTRALVITGPSPISTTSTTRVAVIDTATGKQVGSTVSIAGKPVVPAFSADGTRVVITAAGTTATQLAVIDPKVLRDNGVTAVDDVYTAAKGADALVVLTEWPVFGDLDWPRIAQHAPDAVVIDTRNVLDSRTVTAAGLRYLGNGRSPGF